MAKKTSIINVVVAGDSKPLRNALGKATKSLGTMTKQIGKFSLAAGAAFAAVGAKSIGLAVDFEESLSKANQIFGDAAKGIETSAKGAASAVGLSQAEFLEAASSFGVFGKAAGLTGDDLSTFSTDLVTLSADVASFNNLKPEDALAKLNAGLRGSVEPLQSIGVLMTAAAVEAEGLNMGLIEQGEKLSEGQKIMARHSLIMQQLGSQGATGDFARTSEGLANTQRILNARLKNLGITLGRVLLPIAEKMADWIGRLITKFEEWTPALKNAANAVVDFLTPVKEAVQRWFPILANWMKNVIADKVIPALVTAFNTVKDVITDKVIPALKSMWDWSKVQLPAAFDKTKEHIKEHKELYGMLAGAIGAVVVALVAFKAGVAIKAAVAGLTAAIGLMGISFGTAAISVAAVSGPLVIIAGAIAGLIAVSPEAREAFGKILDWIIEDLEKTIDMFQTLIDLISMGSANFKESMSEFFGGGEPHTIGGQEQRTGGAAKTLFDAAKTVKGWLGLADGGIVTSPTLAMIAEGGEPEAVIPLSKMSSMGTTNITVNMPAGADGNDIVAALEAYVRRNGSIPLATNTLVRK